MKKTYQIPEIEMTVIASAPILAGSLGDDPTTHPFDPNNNPPTTDASSGNLSRRRSVWDYEEDDLLDEQNY